MTIKKIAPQVRRGALAVLAAALLASAPLPLHDHDVTVHRSATCRCCVKWIAHMREHGFSVREVVEEDMGTVKKQQKVPANLTSCHTAVVDGYVLEGHVPADLVRQLLRERPAVAGLSVPGMPIGAPGMDGPFEGGETASPHPYEVLAFDTAGNTSVYARR